jgi:hypothetical protein
VARAKKFKPRRPVELVEWFDAHDAPYHWTPASAIGLDKVLVQSVGFVVGESEEHLTLVTSDDGQGNVAAGIVIPLVNVVNRTRLG